MRWKWLLLLSLISISLVVVSGNDGEKVDDNYENYDEENDEKPEEDNNEDKSMEETSNAEDPPIDSTEAPEEEEPANEDAVDVESVAIEEQKGKYMSYDDYFVASAVDGSDSNYNWNGKYPTSKSY